MLLTACIKRLVVSYLRDFSHSLGLFNSWSFSLDLFFFRKDYINSMNSGSHFYILLYKTGIHHKSVYTLVLLTGINNLNHAGMSAFKKSMKRRNHSPLPLLGDNIGKFVSLKEIKIILRREEWIQSQSQGLLCRRSFSSYRGLSMKAFHPWDIL